MTVTQDDFINKIAAKEELNIATVRQVIKSAETIIFDLLASVSPGEDVTVKPFHGLSIKRRYIKAKQYSKGMFQNIDCPEHVNAKASISKYYQEQINRRLFQETQS